MTFGWAAGILATSIGSVPSSVGKGKAEIAKQEHLPSSFTLLLAPSMLSNFITYALVSPDATLKILILMAD